MLPLSSTPSHSPSRTQEAQATPVDPKSQVEALTPKQQVAFVSLSQTGKETNQCTEPMADLPDVRQERIREIQDALEKGTYSVSSGDLADKLIQEISNQPPDPSSSPT